MPTTRLEWDYSPFQYAGPFNDIPFDNYVQSPIGLVPKAGGKTRLIFHLSYDFKQSGNKSVNYYMPGETCTVCYKDLDYAIKQSLRLLHQLDQTETTKNQSKTVWYGISDLESAFCVLPLQILDFWLLVMKAQHPITGVTYYFVDKCLPFGHCISCAMFQAFSDALAHMVAYLLKVRRQILFIPLTNYLDNFLFAALTKRICDIMLQTFIEMCGHLGVPILTEKTKWGSTIVVFLGILLDGEFFILAVPEEKRTKTINAIQEILTKKSATVKELQRLTGMLNFLNRTIVPGRAFTRRMYAKFTGVTNANLKQHHHVRLDSEFKGDCQVWLNFLTSATKGLNRPFVDISDTLTVGTLDFYTDATKGESLGMGGIFKNQWYFAKWEHDYIKQFNPSIEYLELLGVCMGVFIWADKLKH